MILRNATIKYSGINPDSLTKGSHKRICVSCDQCGKVRWLPYKNYVRYNHNGIDLCHHCTLIGKNNPNYGNGNKIRGNKNPFYGKHHSDETKRNHSKFMSNRLGENSSNWKGGLPLRDHVLPEVQCTKLNKKFNNSEFHHLSKSYGVYIPKELHEHFYHNMKSNQGMDEMSILSFQFIKGEL
jgi:hypothetical protein